MSGLAAIFQRDGASVTADYLQRMCNALRLYGPVKQSTRQFGNLGLCWAQAPHFTPEDKYDVQPVSAAGKWPCIFSGFLMHREELGAKLGIENARLKAMPDSALVHTAFQKWETRFVEHLYGEYAVIVCDTDASRVYAVRSHGNAPPLFYHESSQRLVLGSAPKAIFALGDISRELDEQKIADSLILNNQDAERSFYKNIKSLPLGHLLVAARDTISVSRHFDLSGVSRIHYVKDADYVEAARELFSRAVASCMRACKTPAATLSSGLDSTSVVAEALAYLDTNDHDLAERMVSFTSVPASGWDGRAQGFRRCGNESAPVKAFAKKYPQLDARFVDSADLPLDHDLDKIFLLAETPPFGIKNLHWVMNIMQLARQEGRNVILNGTSGNRTLSFNGRGLYAKLLRQGRLLQLSRELLGSDNRGMQFFGLYSRAISPNLPKSLVRKISALRGNMAHIGWKGHSAISHEYANDMRVDERAKELGLDDSYAGFKDNPSMMQAMGEGGTRDMGQTVNYAMQALTGIQSRDPLGDQKLVKFCAAIPDTQFMKNGKDRLLIKRVMEDRLPAEIIHADRGRQAADWHMRMTRDLPKYRQDIERMQEDADMSRRFDVPRLKALIDNWPDKTPVSASDHPDYLLATTGLMRAVSTARYIRWMEGKN
ncbi:asparagine synthetase B family protein [Sphingorhabdus sp. Alg239-R122]|uniref:asparagine synthetase B family protein n=1 Tax=Sphingorhabdus sp. Alg239-R122 TaxID=2305989 RepID=UPI0013DB6797|nr:asparagine synthetase B family protein [Sphingorhabdus sp. Alg239-R122]